CSQNSTSWPETKKRLRGVAVSMMPSGGLLVGHEPAGIEAGALEVAAQPDPARVDQVDHGRDHLVLAAAVVGYGLHQLEQPHVRCHGRLPTWWIGMGCCNACLNYARDGAGDAHHLDSLPLGRRYGPPPSRSMERASDCR